MVLDKQKLLSELSSAMDSNPDLYLGDLLEYIVERSHPTRKEIKPYYIHKNEEKYPVSNSMLYDALVRYNKNQKRE